MAAVKSAEPGGGAELQRAVRAGLRFEAPAREIIRARGNEYIFCDFERDEKRFAARRPIEFEAVAGFKAKIHRRHEIFPLLDDAARIGVANVLIFEKFLTNPFERAIF